MELNPLSLRNYFASTRMHMAQAVTLQDITTTLLVCTHKQSFELISNAQRENFQYNSKNIKYQSGCIDSFWDSII